MISPRRKLNPAVSTRAFFINSRMRARLPNAVTGLELHSRTGLGLAGDFIREERAMKTILGDVLTWSWFSEPNGYNFNGLLIPDPRGNLCIDPVEPSDEILGELAKRGVSRILITNRNHVRAA